MKLVFVSNFLNHHQLPCALEFIKQGIDYTFIATMPVCDEQLKLGYADMNHQYDFVLRTYDSEENVEKAKSLLFDADVVIAGSCSFPFDWLVPRLKCDKLTFWFSERLYKHGQLQFFYPPTFMRVYTQCTKYCKNKNYYLLCAGGYVAKDYNLMRSFPDKMLRWGYFPKIEERNIDELILLKSKNVTTELLWAGRFIDWKHPDLPIKLMAILNRQKIKAHLTMVGTGKLLERMKVLAVKLNVIDNITFTGAVKFDQVRSYMDKANIFLFTSDKREGWGAVLNESMNSSCAVVVNSYIGSSKYLITDKENGFLYRKEKEFYNKVIRLIKDQELQEQYGREAYKTISRDWCAENAVNNLLKYIKGESIEGNQPVKKEIL